MSFVTISNFHKFVYEKCILNDEIEKETRRNKSFTQSFTWKMLSIDIETWVYRDSLKEEFKEEKLTKRSFRHIQRQTRIVTELKIWQKYWSPTNETTDEKHRDRIFRAWAIIWNICPYGSLEWILPEFLGADEKIRKTKLRTRHELIDFWTTKPLRVLSERFLVPYSLFSKFLRNKCNVPVTNLRSWNLASSYCNLIGQF